MKSSYVASKQHPHQKKTENPNLGSLVWAVIPSEEPARYIAQPFYEVAKHTLWPQHWNPVFIETPQKQGVCQIPA
jgi:hypothetical protein